MWIDIAFFLILIYGFWQGWNHGIVGTILTIALYLFGVVIAFKMAPVTSVVVEQLSGSKHPLIYVAAILGNFLALYLLVHLASGNIEGGMRRMYLGGANRFIGGVMVGAFYITLFSILIWFLNQANGISPDTRERSQSYKILEPIPSYAKHLAVKLQPLMADSYDDFLRWMDKAQQYGIEKTEGKGRVYELPDPDKNQPLFESKPKQSPPPPRDPDSDPIEK